MAEFGSGVAEYAREQRLEARIRSLRVALRRIVNHSGHASHSPQLIAKAELDRDARRDAEFSDGVLGG